jgi:predicted aspartyl protease
MRDLGKGRSKTEDTRKTSPNFIINDFRLFVQAALDSISGYAQLDTGAVSTMVASSVSDSFKKIGVSTLRGAFGELRTEVVVVGHVKLLGATFQNVRARVQPEEHAGFTELPFRPIMTAGVDLLFETDTALRLDFRQGSASYVSDSAEVSSVHQENSIPFHFMTPYRLVVFRSEMGNIKLGSTLFDTGAGFSVLNSERFDELGPHLKREEPVETTDPTGGKTKIPVFRHDNFHIGGVAFGSVRFLVIDLASIEKGLHGKVDFILGLDTMLGHTWTIHLSTQKLGWW